MLSTKELWLTAIAAVEYPSRKYLTVQSVVKSGINAIVRGVDM